MTVCESHSIPGGAAQGWKQDGYHFEAGPSLYSGMASTGTGANPLAHVLQAIGEPLDIIKYNGWNVMIPEGQFVDRVSLAGLKMPSKCVCHTLPSGSCILHH